MKTRPKPPRKRRERRTRKPLTSAKRNGVVDGRGDDQSGTRSDESPTRTEREHGRRVRHEEPHREEPSAVQPATPEQSPSPLPAAEDPLAVAKHRIAAVRPGELERLDEVLSKLKPALSRSLSRGSGLPVEQRRPLLCTLAADVLALLHGHDLVAEALTFQERMRGAKELPAIRAAKRRFRDALSALRDDGADATLVASFERLSR